MSPLGRWMSRLQNKFLVLSLLVGVVPLLALGGISFSLSYRNLVQSNEELAASNLYAVNETVRGQSRRLEKLSRGLLTDSDIFAFIRSAGAHRTTAGSVSRKRAQESLYAIVSNVEFPVSAYLFSLDGTYLLASSNESPYVTIGLLDRESIRSSDWFQSALSADGHETYHLRDVLSSQDQEVFSVIKLLRSPQTYEPFGVAVLNVNAALYTGALRTGKTASGVTCMLVNTKLGEAKTIVGKSEAKLETDICRRLNEGAMKNTSSISFLLDTRSNIYTVAIIDRRDVLSHSFGIVSATLILSGVLALISIVGSIVLSGSIVRPLNRLGELVRRMENNEVLSEPPFPDDDVGRIGNAVLHMDIAKHQLQERLVQSLVAEKEAQIHALQSQINPHFLYNTLSSIYWLCKFGRNEDAAQVAVLLSDNFKYVMETKDDLISVETELHNIDQYLTLQNIRFDGKIRIEKNIDERALDRRILRFIIQPFVENALYHGLEPKMGDWLLHIDVQLDGDDILFSIADNGVGIDDLKRVERGYGISNVIKRIHLKYGNSYGCTFESALGSGTVVRLRVPGSQEEI